LKTKVIFAILALIVMLAACRKAEEWNAEEYNEWFSGGKQTVWETGAGAFSAMFPEISERNDRVHETGDIAFESTFVSGGALHPGLGPLFNSVACTSCHINDGRGTPIGPGTQMISLLFRLSVPGENEFGGPLPAPGFGGQLQQNAIFGSVAEAHIDISYVEQVGNYPDGETYSLRIPDYQVTSSYIPLPAGLMNSPRIAPPVFGLGLLQAVSENTILQYEDEGDTDGDGISGKPNYVWDFEKHQRRLGRFGWKAGQPSILQQVAAAYNEDMGITNFIFAHESAYGQSQDTGIAGDYEVTDSLLHAVAHYVSTLAVPARRMANDETVIAGKKIFNAIGCAACHRPMVQTEVNQAFAEVSNQYIFPYTDMLLHDMGEGLADHRPDFEADGFEWRTPPLWGIGLTEVVNGHNNFLHDGRARTLKEAVLWHGGEAQSSHDRFIALSAKEREEVMVFLRSL